MAKEVNWTTSAIQDRVNIYKYWSNRNKSSEYAEKLDKLFEKSALIIAVFPHIGIKTTHKNVLAKIIKDYRIYYRLIDDRIQILRVWDNRQDSDRINL